MNYEEVFTYENLYKAYKLCRKGVGWKPSTQKYNANAGLNTYLLYKELKENKFRTDGFYEFEINERGKIRNIKSVTIKERIVQRCLCDNCLVPTMSKILVYDNGASLKNKGYGFTIKRLSYHLRDYYNKHGNDGYVLTYDFSKFFASIPHELVGEMLNRYISDIRIRKLAMYFVECFGCVGLGLGSQISQILAITAPNELDHITKEKLKIKWYARYMDDGYLIHYNLDYLKWCLEEIEKECEKLGLHLNMKKTKIKPLNKGFDFLKIKWYLTENGRVIKKPNHKNIIKTRRKLKKLKIKVEQNLIEPAEAYASYQSADAHLKNTDSYKHRKALKELFIELYGKD